MPELDLHRHSFGHPEQELVAGLEPDQTVAAASRPFPRCRLGRAANATLWGVRVFVLLITLMVLYTFIAALGATHSP